METLAKFLDKSLYYSDSKIFTYLDFNPYFNFGVDVAQKLKIHDSKLREFSDTVHDLRYGLEPDIRYKTFSPLKTDQLLIFKTDTIPDSLSSEYKLNYILLHIISMFAAYDHEVSGEEWKYIATFIDANNNLDKHEKLRLDRCKDLIVQQYLDMTTRNEFSFEKLEEFLNNIRRHKSIKLMDFIYDIILSDHIIHPREIALLQKVNEILGSKSKNPIRDVTQHSRRKVLEKKKVKLKVIKEDAKKLKGQISVLEEKTKTKEKSLKEIDEAFDAIFFG